MSSQAYLWERCVAVVLGLALAGCGGESDPLPRQAVSGSVTLDGKPLESGAIRFDPTTPGQATAAGALIRDGKYAIPRSEGPVPGTYKVSINSGAGEAAKPEMVDGMPGMTPTPPPERIPPEYNAQTQLTAEVKQDGANVFDFNLKGRPKK